MQIGKQIVVSTVDQIQNGPSPQTLQSLIANPAAANSSNLEELTALVQLYPACSIFHLLLAKAAQSGEANTAAKALQTAAVNVANREVLFKLIHQPELLTEAKPQQFYPPIQTSEKAETLKTNTSFATVISLSDENEVLVSEEIVPTKVSNTAFTSEKLINADQLNQVETEAENDTSFTSEKLVFGDQLTTGDPEIELKPEEAMAVENDLRVEDINLNFVNTDTEVIQPTELEAERETVEETQPRAIAQENAQENTFLSSDTFFANEIDEEVFEEIMAIEDIHFNAVKTAPTPEAETQPEAEPQPEIKVAEASALTIQDKAEKDMLSSIASIDYFTFNNKFGQNQTPSVQEKKVQETTANLAVALVKTEPAEPKTVSKYHDDKMPYTFMWWLDKTRKEYAGTYQPYVKNQQKEKLDNSLSVGPELHQQYIESIFHTKPPHEMTESSLPAVNELVVKRKEDQLIERFIIQEPHIHPPSSDKLDTENKAKRSSEDADILVTETLAKIYLDQMLYHKALDTYKKLLLKFPEKNRYFSTQIELIERKIN